MKKFLETGHLAAVDRELILPLDKFFLFKSLSESLEYSVRYPASSLRESPLGLFDNFRLLEVSVMVS